MNNRIDSNWLRIILGFAIVITPLVVGMISARLAGDQMSSFGELNQPPLSPPAWLFPVAWTILYILMGISLMLILKSDHEYKLTAAGLFMLQLVLNFIWSPVFFVQKNYFLSITILVMMLITTIGLTVITWGINKTASIILIPYILWMIFATYLNAGVWILNR